MQHRSLAEPPLTLRHGSERGVSCGAFALAPLSLATPAPDPSARPERPEHGAGLREASEGEVAWWQGLEELRCRFERAMAAELGHFGLSPSTYLALEQLSLQAAPLGIAELAERIRLSPSSTSRVVARLVREGLVLRSQSTDDRRSVHGRITDRGRALYEAARPAYRMALACVLDDTGTDPAVLRPAANG